MKTDVMQLINKTDIRDKLVYTAVQSVYEQLCEQVQSEIDQILNPDPDDAEYCEYAPWVKEIHALSPAEKSSLEQAIRDNLSVVMPPEPDYCPHGYEITGRDGPICKECEKEGAHVIPLDELKKMAHLVVKYEIVKFITSGEYVVPDDLHCECVKNLDKLILSHLPDHLKKANWVHEYYYDGSDHDPNNLVTKAVIVFDKLVRYKND